MTEMSTETNEPVLVWPQSALSCGMLAVASAVYYRVRGRLWEVAEELRSAKAECTESKETVQSTFDINQYNRTLYHVAHEAARISPYNLHPKSHVGVQSAMDTRWFDRKLKADFDKTMEDILELAEKLLRTNWHDYLCLAKDMQQHYVQRRKELSQVYPYYFDKEGRKRNHIPDPEPHTIAPLLVIRDLLDPLNSRGQLAMLIVKASDLSDEDKKEHIASLKNGGWTSGTNASTAALRVHKVDPRTGGNYRPEPHTPHGKVVLPATAA